MGRELTGKKHVGEVRIRQKNGDVYVYERITAYNPSTKKTFTEKKTLKGKILAGTDVMIPTRPKKTGNLNKESGVLARRTRVGLTEILNWVSVESGIGAAVRACFPLGDAQKIETIAQYWIGTDGQTLPRLEKWQLMHQTPYEEGMSEDVCSDLFASVAANESGIQQYFLARSSCHSNDRPVIALDTSTVDTYSRNQFEARFGFSKESEDLPSIKLLTLMDINSLQPFAFEQQPGNVPDVISIRNAIAKVKCLMPGNAPLIVTDSGFCSEENMLMFVRNSMKFLTRIAADVSWVRAELDKIKGTITKMENACPDDESTYGKTVTIKHDFKILRQRTRGQYQAGETQILSRKLHLHFFFSDTKAVEDRLRFRKEIQELKALKSAGIELNASGERKAKKYLICKDDGTVLFNDAAINEVQERFGFFVLVSSTEKDAFEALRLYRLRARIEDLFAYQKNSTDGRRPRVWYPDNLRGRQFVQFVALGYHFFLQQRINLMLEDLGKDNGTKSKGELAAEKKLKNWVQQRSITQILEWFDAVTENRISTPYARRRITTESTTRDQLFLKKLGVIP